MAAPEAPTRILYDSRPANGTVALPPRVTGEPPLTSRPTERQTPFGGGAYTSPLAASAPHAHALKGGRRLPLPLLGLLLFLGIGGLFAVALYSRGLVGWGGIRAGDGTRVSKPPAAAGRPTDGTALDEDGAVITEDETVLTKTFEVAPDAAFSFKSPGGSLTVEGWDENRVEVKVMKRGGTPEERRDAFVTLRRGEGVFSLAAADSPVKVSFEVKLPRGAGRVELSSDTAGVKVSNLEAPLTVSVRDGSIKLEDVRGPAQAKSVNGSVDVVYASAEREGAHDFKTVNGSIRIRLAEGMKADVSAGVVNGKIEVADGLGLQPEKRQVGWRLQAPLGGGGEPLNLKTVNGSIKIDK
ncbi:MAG: DUF4097 family beta strand repeat protein [Acidobacteria bacterium]|nr:DUF4097 family beta strand repeat protein [Acidobacteriota bacterium]